MSMKKGKSYIVKIKQDDTYKITTSGFNTKIESSSVHMVILLMKKSLNSFSYR